MFVKICGLTDEDDALLAFGLGADALGFVFAPSPRQISPDRARDIIRRLPSAVSPIGVFRNASREQVVRVAGESGLRGVQLHGVETPEDCRWIAERVSITIKAFTTGLPSPGRIKEYGTAYVLLDSPTPGSGEVFDWSLAENAPRNLKLIMAGGLNPQNVAEAIHKVQPWGVDVSSGVETSPGRKDPLLMKNFVDAARQAATYASSQSSTHADPYADPAIASTSTQASTQPSTQASGQIYDWELE